MTARSRSRTRRPEILIMCPSCPVPRRARAVAAATGESKHREVVQCSEKSCELTWLPQRTHLVSGPQAA